jgi:hypothetical protein
MQGKSRSSLITGIISIVIVGGAIAYIIFKGPSQTEEPGQAIVSTDGLHWHADLTITIKGEKQEIPVDIGLPEQGVHVEQLHTHDNTGKIHMERSGVVRESDIELGDFFEVWGKTFDANCIFDKCTGTEGTLKFKVNGQDNTQFGAYSMKDGDQLEIIFE